MYIYIYIHMCAQRLRRYKESYSFLNVERPDFKKAVYDQNATTSLFYFEFSPGAAVTIYKLQRQAGD